MIWFSHDEYKNKSTTDLENTIEERRLSKHDILEWDAAKRKKSIKTNARYRRNKIRY